MSVVEQAVETPQRVIVKIGNPNPQMTREIHDEDGNVVKRVQYPAKHLNQSVTVFEMRPDFKDAEHVELALSTDNDRQLALLARGVPEEHKLYTLALHEIEQDIQVHTGGVKPTWVASNDPDLEKAIADHFGCPRGESKMLRTNAGRDAAHAQWLSTSAQPAAFNYGALSANSGAGFAVTDTTLAGEIATASGGLIRKQMTYAHTTGTNTSTLTATWTVNGSDVIPVVIATWANFNASSTGTLGDEDVLNATATLAAVGDSVTVTYTLTE